MTNKEILSIPVVIFSMEERTRSLCELSFKKLGFENIIIMDEKIGFSKKLKNFFNLVNDESLKHCNLFLRTDADRISLPGVVELCKYSLESLSKREDGFLITEGLGYEYFMQRFRGATPHIFSRECMDYCLKNEEKLIKDILKPESHIGKYFSKQYNAFESVNLLTNFHEFEQFPSKMYHAFLTRIRRGHLGYYDVPAIIKNPFYGPALKKAIEESKISKIDNQSMNYHSIDCDKDLKLLDIKMGVIQKEKEEQLIEEYLLLYEQMIQNYPGL